MRAIPVEVYRAQHNWMFICTFSDYWWLVRALSEKADQIASVLLKGINLFCHISTNMYSNYHIMWKKLFCHVNRAEKRTEMLKNPSCSYKIWCHNLRRSRQNVFDRCSRLLSPSQYCPLLLQDRRILTAKYTRCFLWEKTPDTLDTPFEFDVVLTISCFG